MRSLLLVLAALVLSACADKIPPLDEVVLCDRSSSAAVCDEAVVRRAALAFLEGSPRPASRFQVITVGCGIEDAARQYEIRVPDRWGRGAVRKRRHWQETERQRLTSLRLPPVNRCSAIAAGIWRASRLLAERPGTIRRLIVISDLREVDRSLRMNFERRVITPAEFVRKLRSAFLLADLSGIKTAVCGVHDRATPDAPTWTARKAERLHLAWSEVFALMGATDVRLTETCDFGSVGRLLASAGAR